MRRSIMKIERALLIGDITIYYSLIKMVINAIVMSHWIACIWNLMAVLEINHLGRDDTWINV